MSRPVRSVFTIALAVALLAAACGDEGDVSSPEDPAEFASERLDAEASTPRGATTTTNTPEGPVDPRQIVGAVINQYSLVLGDCFNRIEELRNGRQETITSRVDCDTPHGFQIFHQLTYPAPHPSIYPGETVMRDFALESCYRQFALWVGNEYETSALDIGILTPTRINFENEVARYRGIHCWVERFDGDAMVANARQSGW